MEVTLEGVLVVAGWLVSVTLWAVLYMKSRKIDSKIANIWNLKVELKDLDGQVIKVPVQYKKGETEAGEPILETKMVTAPLWYTVAWTLSEIANKKFQAWMMNQKSQLSKQLQKGALGDAMKGEGDLGMLMTMLPKKAQTALALIKAAQGLGKGGGQSSKSGES